MVFGTKELFTCVLSAIRLRKVESQLQVLVLVLPLADPDKE
jgi:hypothetical protein